jgi:hypothetical protein
MDEYHARAWVFQGETAQAKNAGFESPGSPILQNSADEKRATPTKSARFEMKFR